MIVSWYGEGCFKLQSGGVVMLTDPLSGATGLAAPRLKADIVLKTITSFPPIPGEDDKNVIGGAGEYNIKDINIFGWPLEKDSTEKFLKTVYVVGIENINCCFLGHTSDLPEPALTEYLKNIDILFVPGGGKPFLEQKIAAKLTKQIQPKIVIPSFFKVPGLKRQSADIKLFLEELNHKKADSQEKFTIKKKELASLKSTQIVVLKP